jgi:hypothetical protein
MFVTVIRMFKMFLPPVQADCIKVTRAYVHFQGKAYLFITSTYLIGTVGELL